MGTTPTTKHPHPTTMITIGANGMTPPMTGTATTPDLLEATMMDLATVATMMELAMAKVATMMILTTTTEAIMMDLTITTTGANGMTPPMTGTATTPDLPEAITMDPIMEAITMDLVTPDPATITPATGANPEPSLKMNCDS